MDKNLFFVEIPGLCLMFIVLRFHSLVDYLTSFSGVVLSFLIQDVLCFLLPSWQVGDQIVVFSGRHVCTNWTATIESYFYIHFCTLRVVMCVFYVFYYLHHKLKKDPVTFSFSSIRLEAGVTWNTVSGVCWFFVFVFLQCTSRRVLYGGDFVSTLILMFLLSMMGVSFVCAFWLVWSFDFLVSW